MSEMNISKEMIEKLALMIADKICEGLSVSAGKMKWGKMKLIKYLKRRKA